MSRKKSRTSGRPLPTTRPPRREASGESDGSDDDAFDRPTAVPDLPSETYARKLMAEIDRLEEPDEFSSVLPPLASEPPELELSEPLRVASTLPPRPESAASRRQRAVTRRDQPAVGRREAVTARPRSGRRKEQRISGSGLELAPISERGSLPTRRNSPENELRDLYAMGDFTGALAVAEQLLAQNPDDLEAQRYAQSCRDVLMQMYSERVGSLRQVVSVAIPADQIRWLSLDHRSGFLLSLVDGTSTIEELLDISGMQKLDALRILHALLEQRVISVSGDP